MYFVSNLINYCMSQKKIIEDLVIIQHDGTVEVNVSRNAPVASELLELDAVDDISCNDGESIHAFSKTVPRLKIAILVVGTRGDVQPFIAIAKRLQASIAVNFNYTGITNFLSMLLIFHIYEKVISHTNV